jgi:hypothetical protein
MCNQRREGRGEKRFQTTFTPHTEMHTKLSLALHLANLTIILSSRFLLRSKKLKQEVPVSRSIRKWSDDTDATLQDCFASTDWNMEYVYLFSTKICK